MNKSPSLWLWLQKQREINRLNLTMHEATFGFKNSPVFTDLQIHTCKTFIALATGGKETQLVRIDGAKGP